MTRGGDFKSDNRRIFGLLLFMWLTAVIVSVFAALQIRKIHDEMQLVGSDAFQLIRTLSRVTAAHLEGSALVSSALTGGEERRVEARALARRALDEADSRINNLNEVVNRIGASGMHGRRLDEVSGISLRLRVDQARFGESARRLLNEAAQGKVIDRGELQRILGEDSIVDRTVEELESAGSMLIEEALAATKRHEGIAQIEMLGVTLIALILALMIAFQIRRLQTRLVISENLALLGKMTVTLHHEINNPLAVIIGNSYLLAHGKLDPAEQARAVEGIREMAQKISDVVKRLGEARSVVSKEYLDGLEMLDLDASLEHE